MHEDAAMRPVPPAEYFGGSPVIIAEHQPGVLALPARVDETTVITTWELTAVEKAALLAGAPLVLQVMTFGSPLQPVMLYVQGVEEEAGNTE